MGAMIYIQLGAGDFSGPRYFSTILGRRMHVGFLLVIFHMVLSQKNIYILVHRNVLFPNNQFKKKNIYS